jgi:DNA-binding NarL/FixJ family response regulator
VAEPLLYLGRWDEALDVAERALDLAPLWSTRCSLSILSGSIALARGDTATAVRLAAASRAMLVGVRYEDQKNLPQVVLDIGLALATEGPAAAVAAATEAVEQYDLSGSSARYVWPVLVIAAAAARQAPGEAADALLCKLRTLVEKQEVSGPVQHAWQLSYEAIDPRPDDGASGAADATARLAAADAAVAAWEAVDQPYPAALALVGAARVALSGGAPGRAAAAARLRRAAPIADRLGARPLAAEISALLSQAAGPSAGSATGPHHERLGLTGRELEVLRLVTAGQSNREIATALFISPKTASVHVSNILGKLGAATRTEAAARAHALRLFDDVSGGGGPVRPREQPVIG